MKNFVQNLILVLLLTIFLLFSYAFVQKKGRTFRSDRVLAFSDS